jgi:hypothetical protein
LPLDALTPRAFEDFMRDLVAQYRGVADAHLFGGPGHDQLGIDLIVTSGGETWTFQCKRVSKFGPEAVRRVIADTDVDGHHVLVLSRDASPGARLEIGRHAEWSLWDANDVSRIVRSELDLDDARRLVDTYFPGWRRDFLGVEGPGPWLTSDEFFRPNLRPSAALSHRWTLVGRDEQLAAFDEFLGSTTRNSLVLVGRGGSGKSRLLRAMVEHLAVTRPETPVRFLAPEASAQAKDLEMLPENTLLVVDDAHDRDDLPQLLALLARNHETVRLVVATRSYAAASMLAELRRTGHLTFQDHAVVELPDLTRSEAERLAREVLIQRKASDPERTARAIANAVADSPLFVVLAAEQVANGIADPHRLVDDPVARDLLLREFRDAIVGDIGSPGEQQVLRELLRLVAVAQPFGTEDDAFRTMASAILDRPADTITRHLRTLEEAGILLRRGATLRVVPDLLGDYLVGDACLDGRGRPTGYADRVLAAASGMVAQNVIVNVAKLDWRVNSETGAMSTLLDNVWQLVREEFLRLDILGRADLLKRLAPLSYYQPARAIALARTAIANPTDEIRLDPVWRHVREFDYAMVLDAIPDFVRGAAYHFDHIAEVADLLWRLGRDRNVPLNSPRGNAIRVLADLVTFSPDKPLAYSEVILDRAIAWLADPQIGTYVHSPFDVIERVLATEAEQTRWEGFTLHMQAFPVRVDVVRPLRDKVVRAALSVLSHPDVRIGVRGADIIGAALRYPGGLYGREITDEERDKWSPEFLSVLKHIQEIATTRVLDAVVRHRLRGAVSWHAKHGSPATRPTAREVHDILGSTFADRLVRAVLSGWALDAIDEQDVTDHAARNEAMTRYQARVAKELLREHPSAATAVDALADMLRTVARADPTAIGAGPLLNALFAICDAAVEEVVRRVLTDRDPTLAPYFHVALHHLFQRDRIPALACAQRALALRDAQMAREVAVAYTWSPQSFDDDELALMRELSKHDDVNVRLQVARGLAYSTIDRAVRIRLLLGVRIDGSSEVAAGVADAFTGTLSLDDLTAAECAHLLGAIAEVDKIDDYHIGHFIAGASRRNPWAVYETLKGRIAKRQATESATSFDPIPYAWSAPLVIRETPEFGDILADLRGWVAADPSWERSHWGAMLLGALARKFDRTVLDALVPGPIDEADLIAATALLREMPASLIWTEVDWVAAVLDRAAFLGDNCFRRVAAELESAVMSGVRSGIPGQPFPQDIEQRDRSAAAAESFTPGTPAHRFYRSLARSAERAIRDARDRHADL